jgi:hypothetical protein
VLSLDAAPINPVPVRRRLFEIFIALNYRSRDRKKCPNLLQFYGGMIDFTFH